MRTFVLVGLIMLSASLAAPAAASNEYSGRIAVGLTGPGIACGGTIPCEPTDALGYDGLTAAAVDLAAGDAGQAFTLVASDAADIADADVCFYDGPNTATATQLACFRTAGDEAGTVPAGAVMAYIVLWSGVDATYKLTIG